MTRLRMVEDMVRDMAVEAERAAIAVVADDERALGNGGG